MPEYILDLTDVTTREGFWNLLRDVLPLPDYFGSNLDALYDVLTEGSPRTLIFRNAEALEAEDPAFSLALRRMLRDAEGENRVFTYTLG